MTKQQKVPKFFNTAGPMIERLHYQIPPLTRWDLEEIEMLIMQEKYFLLHAPRQSGKTSTLLALQKYINESDRDEVVIYVNVESAQVARHNIDVGIKTIVARLGAEAEKTLKIENIQKEFLDIFNSIDGAGSLISVLNHLCKKTEKKVILLIDEIDSLIGDTLVSVLRQLRTGYNDRSVGLFPISVILCGLVDIKDYKIHKSDGEIITGGSCFNIKSESLTLGNFSQDEIKTLYLDHSQETGQIFEDKIFDLAYEYTGGQPWLVNALAYQVCFKKKENRDRTIAITVEMFKDAKEELILSRQTHLDQLTDKLKEERVYRIIEPIILGKDSKFLSCDEEYCIDLGLIKRSKKGIVISNGIYKEIIIRELTHSMQTAFLSIFDPEWINEDKSINVEKLMTMFVQFWRENSEIWAQDMQGYVEAAPHLTFFSFLQRVSNGHGFINREYGLGMKRADLYLKWNSPVGEQRIIFEIKLHSELTHLPTVKKDGLKQTAIYADKCNATESHLLIFNRRKNISWKEKIFTENKTNIKIWGL